MLGWQKAAVDDATRRRSSRLRIWPPRLRARPCSGQLLQSRQPIPGAGEIPVLAGLRSGPNRGELRHQNEALGKTDTPTQSVERPDMSGLSAFLWLHLTRFRVLLRSSSSGA